MNERIRLLAEQAGLITLQDDRENWDRENWHEYINDVEKFAGLLIRECVSLFDGSREMKTVGLLSHTQVIGQIKKHFGVQE